MTPIPLEVVVTLLAGYVVGFTGSVPPAGPVGAVLLKLGFSGNFYAAWYALAAYVMRLLHVGGLTASRFACAGVWQWGAPSGSVSMHGSRTLAWVRSMRCPRGWSARRAWSPPCCSSS